LSVGDYEFAAFLALRFERGDLDDEAALRNAGDLLIACGAVAGDPAAMAVLDRTAIATLRGNLSRIVGEATVDEVIQRLREKLLMARPGGETARLASYAGRGPLRTWVRAVATRIAIRVRAQQARLEDAELALEVPGEDLAVHSLREHFKADFRSAFERALSGLRPRDRMLLRQQFVDGLGTEALAALHDVHRVTMYRRLAKIRRKLLSATKRELARRILLNGAELDSLMRDVKSHVDLTLERVLASQTP
jgi:RNA polymerase sigma-70 factor (ECF subfamily)